MNTCRCADFVRWFCILCGVTLAAFAKGQSPDDLDGDGMNDQLEMALAQRFAPEWRFARRQPGDGSDQNNSEPAFPMGVEDWYDEVVSSTGEYPELFFPWDLDDFGSVIGQSVDITDINDLSNMISPVSGIPVSEYDGISPLGEVVVKIDNYPSEMPGDPDGFPTYFRCFMDDDRTILSFILWYPYDEKSAPLDVFEHRGDWGGICLALDGISDSDISDPSSVADATISYVYHGGHGHKKVIYPYSTSYQHYGDHPMVFIASGAHTSFPTAGEFHNYDIPIVGQYDDLFPGNGLVVQSWDASRQLINLGEHPESCADCTPMVGWLTYRGRWGPDMMGEGSSPAGPSTQEIWNGHIGADEMLWEQYAATAPDHYSPFEPLSTAHENGWFSDRSDPGIVFFNHDRWHGPEVFVSGPQAYPDVSLVGLSFFEPPNFDPVSTLFLGDVRLRLFTGLNFTGTEVLMTNSSSNVSSNFQSMIVERGDGEFLCDQVVDYQNTSGQEDGTWAYPYNTVEEAVNAATAGQHICIRAGDYPENFIGAGYINKQVTIHSYFGTAKVGD